MTERFAAFTTIEGAYGSKAADLFPTMAATRIGASLGVVPLDSYGLERVVRARRVLAGGVGAQPGQPADAWSTVYAIDALVNSGMPVPNWMPEYLLTLHADGGFAMAVAQKPETWSSAFAMIGLARCGVPLPDPEASIHWLAAALLPSGGFTWSPAWVSRSRADVRATSFVIRALRSTSLLEDFRTLNNLQPTIDYLLDSQQPSGAFQLDDRHPACLWGTGEAVSALRLFGERPVLVEPCVDFVTSMWRSDGGYRRGPDYPNASDIWATMHAVDVRLALGDDLDRNERAMVTAFVESCQLGGGGYTYRPPDHAADVLVTSAAVIAGSADPRTSAFLRSCRMPGEGGVAFMPARGSEARSALWAVTALHLTDELAEDDGLARWAHHAQNPDGGFGPWEGRASNAVSTNSVLAALTLAYGAMTTVI